MKRTHVPNPTGKNGREPLAIELRTLARTYTAEAMQVLYSVAMDPKVETRTRVEAASAVLDRGWGKPSQEIDLRRYEMQQVESLTKEEIAELVPAAIELLRKSKTKEA